MRISRSIQLHPESASTHLYWRAHNKEFYLSAPEIKHMYLRCCQKASEKINNIQKQVAIHSYCLMSNHVHLGTTYLSSSRSLSEWMRSCHGRFGASYNRLHHRSGKVAEGRPKTSLIQDDEHLMRVHFYIEANPIRAGLCQAENLHLQKYSSFRFYAYGIRDEFTCLLTIPDWYMKLGKTAKQRQAKYRTLFYTYLKESKEAKNFSAQLFIGTECWLMKMKQKLRELMRSSRFQAESTNSS